MLMADMKLDKEDKRVSQVLLGALLLALLALAAGVVVIGSPHLPGVFGQWVAFMVGLMTTPVFLEISAFVVGLMVVFAINHWREKREGPELVELDDASGTGNGKLRR
jgi:uncharacterized membrane protein